MGKFNAFQIVYDSNTNVFKPNQTVKGTVIIDVNEPIKARNVTLHVVGKADTHWTCHTHSST